MIGSCAAFVAVEFKRRVGNPGDDDDAECAMASPGIRNSEAPAAVQNDRATPPLVNPLSALEVF